MSQFQLMAKVNIQLSGGMKIDKGQTFFVNLPFGRLPFDSINSKEAVIKQLELRNFNIGEFYQFNLSSCIRQQNSLTAQFVSFSLSNLANIFYPPQFLQ